MKKFGFGFIAVVLSLSIVAYAHPFFINQKALMPGGPFAGQPLDTSKLRGLVYMYPVNSIIPEALSSSHGYIINISHNGKLYIGRLKYDSPQSVDFIYEKFTNMMGGHADLVYHLKEDAPLELFYEIRDSSNKQGYEVEKLETPIRLQEVVLTGEVIRAVGDNTPLKEGGLNNSFALAYRITSVPERLIEPVIEEGRKTTVFDIPFDAAATSKSFWETIRTQSDKGLRKNYNLVSNSCITSAIRGLANGLSEQQEQRVESEMNKAFQRIAAISRNDMSDAEMKQMMGEYLELAGSQKIQIKTRPIMEEKYFTEWLTPEQLEIGRQLCKKFFE